MTDEKICKVKIDKIQVSPFQPRRHFSEEGIEELASSIRTVGLIHPPVVRAITAGDRLLYYELVAGERRWRACKKAGLEEISVIVRNTSDELTAEATLIENVQRIDLDPVEMAHALRNLVDVFSMTQEEVASRIGKKRSTVANYLRLLSLPEKIRSSVSSGEISMGHAKAILSLQSPEIQEKLHSLIIEKQFTVRQAERQSAILEKSPKRKKKEIKQQEEAFHLQEVAEQLQEKLGTKVMVGNGKITFHYYDLEDLERLLGKIAGAPASNC
ncbi:MAG: ParB/RepB/Spo0J family partition protein [Chlamydiia bacterium]|nr:ParB/RepB/Spo0J family partition protein [Chlamydiia bacterium]